MAGFEVITLTDAARERVGEIMSSKPDAKGIRIGVKMVAVLVWNTQLISLMNQSLVKTR